MISILNWNIQFCKVLILKMKASRDFYEDEIIYL